MTLDIVIHRTLLVEILRDIYATPTLATALGFKGGTAVLLFYGLPRFSVDLDFDLLDETPEDRVFEALKEILERYGTVEARNKRFSFIYLLTYKDKLQGAQKIKVEVNKRNFGSTYGPIPYFGVDVLVMSKEDMVAHKLVAMHERIGKTNRDVFDIWFFFKNQWPINEWIVESRTQMTYKEFLQVCIKELESFDNQSILSGIGELLDAKQKAWAKQHLKAETIFLLKLTLKNFEVN